MIGTSRQYLLPGETTRWFTYPVHAVNVFKGELVIDHPEMKEAILVGAGEHRTFPSAQGVSATVNGDENAVFLLSRTPARAAQSLASVLPLRRFTAATVAPAAPATSPVAAVDTQGLQTPQHAAGAASPTRLTPGENLA
jgi:hypothetical protein